MAPPSSIFLYPEMIISAKNKIFTFNFGEYNQNYANDKNIFFASTTGSQALAPEVQCLFVPEVYCCTKNKSKVRKCY